MTARMVPVMPEGAQKASTDPVAETISVFSRLRETGKLPELTER